MKESAKAEGQKAKEAKQAAEKEAKEAKQAAEKKAKKSSAYVSTLVALLLVAGTVLGLATNFGRGTGKKRRNLNQQRGMLTQLLVKGERALRSCWERGPTEFE